MFWVTVTTGQDRIVAVAEIPANGPSGKRGQQEGRDTPQSIIMERMGLQVSV